MERIIEYRAWDKVHSKMCKVIALGFMSNEALCKPIDMDVEAYPLVIGKHCVLLQYTGFKDKNEIKIFESDIVKYQSLTCSGFERKRGWVKAVVIFKYAMWYIDQVEKQYTNDMFEYEFAHHKYHKDNIEVIGNNYIK